MIPKSFRVHLVVESTLAWKENAPGVESARGTRTRGVAVRRAGGVSHQLKDTAVDLPISLRGRFRTTPYDSERPAYRIGETFGSLCIATW
jgi:hypothetical protein